MPNHQPNHRKHPFDAVLVVAFGGPQGMSDVRPFLDNVLRGRRVPPERIEEVVAHYERFGGYSPMNELTQRQADGLAERLRASGLDLPVYVGMRNWHPFVADTLAEMSSRGVRRAIGFIAAAHHCHSSCGQYKENVRDARRALADIGLPDVQITYAPSWFDHPSFIAALVRHIETAIDTLDPSVRDAARLVFTAHSIPMPMAEASRYREQLAATARLVADRLGRHDHALVYQSRSGRPTDPWLEPDICDYLRAERAAGLKAAVISPIGFISDHIEVLYDLDTEAAQVCEEIGLPMTRAATVNDDPQFIDMMTDVVRQTHERFRRFPPLPIVSAT